MRNIKGQYTSILNPICRDCGVKLNEINWKDKTRGYICRECVNKEQRTRRKNTPKEIKSKMYRIHNLMAFHGLSVEQYDKMFEEQNGLCKICGLPEINRRLAVDHNHNTGKIRGLLCTKCNNAIGCLDVDSFGTLNLQKAIGYLGDRK